MVETCLYCILTITYHYTIIWRFFLGKPLRSERKKKKTHIFQDEERQMAEDIFGVKFDYGEFEQYGDEEELEEDYEEDLEVKYVQTTL